MQFISSANLTEYAVNLNMKMGVLIEGGELPGQVVMYSRELISQEVLRKVNGSPIRLLSPRTCNCRLLAQPACTEMNTSLKSFLICYDCLDFFM